MPRPSTSISHAPHDESAFGSVDASRFMAVEIGGTKLQVVVGDGEGRIQHRWRDEVRSELGGAGIRERLEQIFVEVKEGYAIAAVGVGFGGPVDVKSGRIRCSHQIEGWADYALRDWVGERVGVEVVVDNDANVAALGEALVGAGEGLNPVSYVTLGSGVGGGLVVDGAIYHGASPGESEIGHLRLDRSGAVVESRCSGWAVDARIREAVRRNPVGLLAERCRGMVRGEARHLREALEAGDPQAIALLGEVAGDLAFGLSHVVHLAHPEVLVLGGGLSLVGEALRAAVEAALEGFVMEAFRPLPRVRLAGLGEDSVPVGALLMAAGSVGLGRRVAG